MDMAGAQQELSRSSTSGHNYGDLISFFTATESTRCDGHFTQSAEHRQRSKWETLSSFIYVTS